MEQPASSEPFRYPLWVRGDLDGFFGLMVDNLVQVLLIIDLCSTVAGLPADLIYLRVLPGVAVSLLIGNLFYGAQVHYVARRDRNAACTALPYGINTPSVIAYTLFIMGPVYRSYEAELGPEAAGDLAWKAGVVACLVSGVIELFGALFAERLRRVTPRAALLGVLAALGVTFIASDFAFRIYSQAWIGLLPMFILLLAYFSHYRFPLGLPGGFLAIAVGTAVAWIGSVPWVAEKFDLVAPLSGSDVRQAFHQLAWVWPTFVGDDLLSALGQPELMLRFLTVSIPMGVINVLGALQNIESAEAGGDRFHTAPSLTANGIGSIGAALFGSCFPTTIYIGHPGWKALGARSGYSILNGLFLTICFLCGAGPLLRALIPIEAGAPIVLYIGIVITAQAFQTTPRQHAPAVALAFFPAMAALLVANLPLFIGADDTTRSLAQILKSPTSMPTSWGMLALTGANSGWLVVTLVLSATGVALIDRKPRQASCWCAAAAALTFLGFIHSFRVEANVLRELFIWQPTPTGDAVVSSRGLSLAAAYAIAAVLFAIAHKRWHDPTSP